MKYNRKICLYISNLARGGAERVCINVAEYLHKQGKEVYLITSYKSNKEYILPKYINRVCLREDYYSGNKIKRNIILIRDLRIMIKKINPDVVISFMSECNVRSILASVGLKTKCIVSVRNDPNIEHAGLLGYLSGKLIMPLSDGCIFQTDDAFKWFPKKLQRKSVVIGNPVREEVYDIDRQPIEGSVVSLGRLEPQKNYEFLINSFTDVVEKIKDAKLYIYGEGSQKNKLQNLINYYKLNESIKLCGFTENINKVLKEADIFVLPSDYEGMPNALMESLAAGVPSIATDCPCGGPKTLIKDGYNGILVPVRDQKKLSSAIISLLNDNKKKEKLSNNSKITSEKYRTNIINKDWEQFIDEIVDKKS